MPNSKIIQICSDGEGYNITCLCEDGSLWYYSFASKDWNKMLDNKYYQK
jgi:hypothetical protein